VNKNTPPNIIPLKPPDAQALKSQLVQNLPAILHALLPNGLVRAGKFIVGDVRGNKGESLVIELHGSKAGLWHDFATGDGGDILDLWAAVKGFDRKSQFTQLITDIQNWLGAGVPVAQPPSCKHRPHKHTQNLGEPTAKWDYTDAQGKLIASVYRYDPKGGRKQFRPWDARSGVMKAPDVRPLYNQMGMAGADTVVLVEGEKCADALITQGICATTAMNGAKAPIEKTDWSPLADKTVIIWPDHDEPGLSYARRAASAAARAGACHVEILTVQADKPPKWDAADAVAEGLCVSEIIKSWDRVVAKNQPRRLGLIPLYSVADLRSDVSPMPEDLIAPRLLTPGGILVFGGAPKVGKSDFLISLLAHMAAGEYFLGLTTKRPLRVFYLQAEVQYHYLRERIQKLSMPEPVLDRLQQNFVMTPQTRLILNEDGIRQIVLSVKEHFGDIPPDIIAIDPIRNVFDGGGIGGENDNDAMMFFLSQRIEKLREQINPNAGLILAHHTKKVSKKHVEEDPFQALSGAGSLRSYYTSGIILHRPDETRPERSMVFELRNGPEIAQKTIIRSSTGWAEVNNHERLALAQLSKKPDAETLRKKDAILQLIYTESLQGRVYTARQFSDCFQNKYGFGSSRSLRNRINVLSTKGHVKFFKNVEGYGLPAPQRSRQGYLCVEDMALSDGTRIYPSHFKHPKTDEILPVDDPQKWITTHNHIADGEDS